MGTVLSQGQEDRKAMQTNQNEWAQAAQRRLQNMRDGNNGAVDWIKEKAQDVFTRNNEANVVNQGSVITGSNPMTKARMLDFETAQKQAADPKQPMPNLTSKYPAPQE